MTQNVIFTIQKECHQTLTKKFLWQKKSLWIADYPLSFIESAVNEFQKSKEYKDENFIISPTLFEIAKTFISVETLLWNQ